MDINEVTDVKELKARAFDLLAQKEVVEKQLQLIFNRLKELREEPEKKPEKKSKKES